MPLPENNVKNELKLTLSILQQQVYYSSVRNNIMCLNTLERANSSLNTQTDFIFSDSSTHGMGFFISYGNKRYAFSYIFENNDTLKSLHVNTTETVVAVLALIVYFHIHMKQNHSPTKQSQSISYIDNNTALSILATRRCSLKSEVLCDLGSIMSNLAMSFHTTNKIAFGRVTSEQNFFADLASRIDMNEDDSNRFLGSFELLASKFSLHFDKIS